MKLSASLSDKSQKHALGYERLVNINMEHQASAGHWKLSRWRLDSEQVGNVSM
jgi:hypothetical protein